MPCSNCLQRPEYIGRAGRTLRELKFWDRVPRKKPPAKSSKLTSPRMRYWISISVAVVRSSRLPTCFGHGVPFVFLNGYDPNIIPEELAAIERCGRRCGAVEHHYSQ